MRSPSRRLLPSLFLKKKQIQDEAYHVDSSQSLHMTAGSQLYSGVAASNHQKCAEITCQAAASANVYAISAQVSF